MYGFIYMAAFTATACMHMSNASLACYPLLAARLNNYTGVRK